MQGKADTTLLSLTTSYGQVGCGVMRSYGQVPPKATVGGTTCYYWLSVGSCAVAVAVAVAIRAVIAVVEPFSRGFRPYEP